MVEDDGVLGLGERDPEAAALDAYQHDVDDGPLLELLHERPIFAVALAAVHDADAQPVALAVERLVDPLLEPDEPLREVGENQDLGVAVAVVVFVLVDLLEEVQQHAHLRSPQLKAKTKVKK